MDFKNQYLSYEEYQRLGGEIQGAPFDLLEYRAEKEIDKPTFNRFRDLDSEEHPMELKICVYELMHTASCGCLFSLICRLRRRRKGKMPLVSGKCWRRMGLL